MFLSMPFGPPLEADASRYVRAAPTISEAVAHVLKGVVALAVVAALQSRFLAGALWIARPPRLSEG